jgi:hypothetical protein
MIGHVICRQFGVDVGRALDLKGLSRSVSAIPRIAVSHDDNPFYKSPEDLAPDKSHYRRKRVLFLVRDPRDVLVSSYFQKKERELRYRGTLREFIEAEVGGIETIIAYYNIWLNNKGIPDRFILIRYEDLMKDTRFYLSRIMREFLDLDVEHNIIEEAVQNGSFENMRTLEEQGAIAGDKLRPRDLSNPDSFKTRRGIIGGHRDYLQQSEIEFLDEKIARMLRPEFGYGRRSGLDLSRR